jgi:hypothetical protein
MSGERPDEPAPEELTPAERRLLRWIAELPAPEPTRDLVAGVVRSARWQRSVRPYLEAIGAIAEAAGAGARALLERPRR